MYKLFNYLNSAVSRYITYQCLVGPHRWYLVPPPGDIFKIHIANRKTEYARCVAYLPGQIWKRWLQNGQYLHSVKQRF